MDTDKKYVSGVAAAKDFFGAASAQEWMQEWKKLTDADKEEVIEGLRKLGYVIEKK